MIEGFVSLIVDTSEADVAQHTCDASDDCFTGGSSCEVEGPCDCMCQNEG